METNMFPVCESCKKKSYQNPCVHCGYDENEPVAMETKKMFDYDPENENKDLFFLLILFSSILVCSLCVGGLVVLRMLAENLGWL